LANIESGDRNIVSRVDKDSQGKTLAQGGNADEISQGNFQIQTATWRDFAKQAGVDTDQFPTAMSAPRDVQARVASVIPLSRFGPRTQTMLRQQFGPLDAGQTIGALGAALAPKAPPGQATAPTMAPVTIPPAPGAGAGARPALPPPEAPIAPGAGGAQTAGPGAPTGTVIPPSPPGSAADVEAIKAGMIGAGANPTTLAPGGGSAPAALPGAVVTAQAAQPSSPQFQMRPLTPTEQAQTSYTLDPQTQRNINALKAGAYNTKLMKEALDAENTAVTARREKADAARLAIESAERKSWETQARPATDADLAAQSIPREHNVTYQIDNTGKITTGAVPLDPRLVNYALKEQERYQKDYAEPGDKVAPLHGILDQMEALDRKIKTDPGGGQGGLGSETARKLRTFLTARGYGDQGFTDTTANQEAYNTLHNQLVLRLKGLSGTSLGNMSNTDLAFLDASGPGLNLTPEGRMRTTAALRQILTYQKNLYDAATDAIHDPKGDFTLRYLNEKISKVPPAIPTFPGFNVPKEIGQAWMEHNKPKRGTAYYGSDGQLRVWGVDPLQ
jgi:hypothetical protein